jgi:hypothetical protein
MDSAPSGNLLAYMSQVPDPRGRQGLRHPLSAMLATVVCAILCGHRGYQAIVQWLHLQPPSTWHRLGFTRRPPQSTCFETLMGRLPAEVLEDALSRWIGEGLQLSVEDELRAVALDGKSLRGTLGPHQRMGHLLAALDQKLGCVLSQISVDEKTNEAKAALDLLDGLALEGRVITGDAMFCQHEVCDHIRDRGGHYFFVVKDNQPTLLQEIQAAFVETGAFSPLRPARI